MENSSRTALHWGTWHPTGCYIHDLNLLGSTSAQNSRSRDVTSVLHSCLASETACVQNHHLSSLQHAHRPVLPETTSLRGARGTDAHHRLLYKGKKNIQQVLVLMAKQKFPMENFILTHNIFVSVEKAKHQVAVCLLLQYRSESNHQRC